MTNDQLEKLLTILRENRVTRFKTADIELEIALHAPDFSELNKAEREKLEKEEDERIAFAHVGLG